MNSFISLRIQKNRWTRPRSTRFATSQSVSFKVSALKHLIASYTVGESDQLSRANSLFTDAFASPKNILALSL